MARIVIIGAGVGGLGTAIGLADRGHDVLVVERDPPPPTTRGDAAFEEWDRRNVPQFRQAHAFSARSRNLLATFTPAVLDRLRDDGIRGDQLLQAARTARTAPPRGQRVHRPPRPPSSVRVGAPPDGGGAPTRRDPLPDDEVAETERQSLIAEGVIRGSLRDPVLGRAFLRRINLLDAPQAILDDPEVERRARETQEFFASRPPRTAGPDRAELLAAIERARPAASAASPTAYQSVRTAR